MSNVYQRKKSSGRRLVTERSVASPHPPIYIHDSTHSSPKRHGTRGVVIVAYYRHWVTKFACQTGTISVHRHSGSKPCSEPTTHSPPLDWARWHLTTTSSGLAALTPRRSRQMLPKAVRPLASTLINDATPACSARRSTSDGVEARHDDSYSRPGVERSGDFVP